MKEIALQTARGEVVGRPLDCFTADEAAKAIQKIASALAARLSVLQYESEQG